MTTALNPSAVIEPSGLVRACSWCVTRARMAELDRLYARNVSHGVCPDCQALLNAELEARS